MVEESYKNLLVCHPDIIKINIVNIKETKKPLYFFMNSLEFHWKIGL